jgi:protein SCO1/2
MTRPRMHRWIAVAALGLTLAGCRQASSSDAEAPKSGTPAAVAPEQGESTLGRLSPPDVTLTNQRGEPVRIRSLLEGHTVVLGFIFTRCTTICPPMGMGFGRLQRLLGERAGKDVQLVSVSLDPDYDTPEQLEAWGKRFGAGAGWTLLTGSREDVDTFLKAMKVYTPAKEQHAPIVLVGNGQSGQWVRVHGLGSPQNLLAAVDRMASRAPQTEVKQ